MQTSTGETRSSAAPVFLCSAAVLLLLLFAGSGSRLIAQALPPAASSSADTAIALLPGEGSGGSGGGYTGRNPDRLSEGGDPRRSFGVSGAFLLPQNDLRQTTGPSPQITVGVHAEALLRGVHQIRPDAEWMYFRQGHQTSSSADRSQVLDTKVRALLFGGEYLYRIGGADKRLSAGGGLYLIRWSVNSVNTITFGSEGTAQASGDSSWWRFGDGFAAAYRLTHKLELQGRWIHSNYGYEHIPINVATLGAGWRL